MPALSGKTCVVTGGTGAIGKATAVKLAQERAHVVLVGRDPAKLAAAAAEVGQAAPNTAVDTQVVDFSLLSSVRSGGRELRQRFPRIHAVVFASAVFHPTREITKEGFEKTFVTNYLSQFVLTQELLPAIKAGAPSRIVFVASRYQGSKLNFADLQFKEGKFSIFRAVGPTKLAQVTLAAELGERLAGTGVVAHACHPGLVKSDLTNTMPTWQRAFFKAMSGSPEKGADTPAWLVTSEEAGKVSGKFWAGRKQIKAAGEPSDPAARKRLWEESEKLAGVAASPALVR